MSKTVHNLIIVNQSTGKTIPIDEVGENVTARELLEAYTRKINLPAGTHGVLVRKLTHKQLLSSQSISSAGVEDNETLVADYERTVGGYFEFYEDGRVKSIETEPEETPYLAEILREIRRLNNDIQSVNERLTSMSTEIKEIHNSFIVVAGKDVAIHPKPDNEEG